VTRVANRAISPSGVGSRARTMVPVPSTSYSLKTAARNSLSSLLRVCHPPFFPLFMRFFAAARFRRSLWLTRPRVSSCWMTTMARRFRRAQTPNAGLTGARTARTRFDRGVARSARSVEASVTVQTAARSRVPRVRGRRKYRVVPLENRKKFPHEQTVTEKTKRNRTCSSSTLLSSLACAPLRNPRAVLQFMLLRTPGRRLPSRLVRRSRTVARSAARPRRPGRSSARDVGALRLQGAPRDARRRRRANPRSRRVGVPTPVLPRVSSDLPRRLVPSPPVPSPPPAQSFLITLLLFICTCTYVKMKAPQLMDPYRTGLRGLLWKAARIGERLSPWVSASCLVFAAHTFWVGGGK